MSFGGGTQSTSSSGSGENWSLTDMLSNSFGQSSGASGNQSQGSASSSGTSQSTGGTFLDPVQQQRMQAMWGQGANLMAKQGDMQKTAQGIVNPLMKQGQNAMNTLGGLQNVDKMVNAQTAGLQSGLARMGAEQNRQIGDTAQASGAFGGSRHGIQEGVAKGEIARAFQEGYGDIISGARSSAASAAGMAGNLAPQLANLGMMPSQAAWAPLQQMQNLLGPATVLSKQQSTSQNLSQSLQSAFGWSKQQAENFATAMTKSSSYGYTKHKSKGSSANFNVGVGGGSGGANG